MVENCVIYFKKFSEKNIIVLDPYLDPRSANPKGQGPGPNVQNPMDLDLDLGPIKKLGSGFRFSWTRPRFDTSPSLAMIRLSKL